MNAWATPPENVLAAFGLEAAGCERITTGHINQTWLLRQNRIPEMPDSLILQRVNRIFPPAVQGDIVQVTAHLRTAGVPTIELIATRTEQPFLELDGAVWRLMKYIEGTTTEHVESAAQAREAGRILGEFHRALKTFRGTLSHARMNVHDFSLHLQRLDMALLRHDRHRHHAEISALAAQIVEVAAEVRDFPPTRNVPVHGDPKISNIIFRDGQAVCLIDLDTLTTLPVELDIADAMRSWCNTAAEDSPTARFSAEIFAAACAGYSGFSREVAEILPDATAKIAVELAARFCADALEEGYFGWDAGRFDSASLHNQVRCQAQLAVATDVLRQRADLRRLALGTAL